MAKSCLYSPVDKNKKPYKALPEYRTAFGMEAGTDAFLKALSPSFQKRHEGKLKIDDQGVATLETAVKIPEMKELIGFKAMKNKLEKEYKFKEVSNTADNFRMLVNEAKVFNDQNEDYVAYPEKTENGIRNVVHKKDNNSVNTFNNMYGSMALNDRLLSIFEPLGLKISDLLEAEKGYTGITDFANARITAEGFINIIRVANNMGGQLALSEEMSHLIVRMFKDKQNLQRLISAFAANQAAIQAVLGDDYSLYVEQLSDNEGNVNYDEIAEEAVGRLLQGKLQEEVIKDLNTSYIGKLWHRFLAYLKNAFKEYNASDVEQALIDADQTLGTLAKNILKGSMGITREDIESTVTPDIEADTMYYLGEKGPGYNTKANEYKGARNAHALVALLAEKGESEDIRELARILSKYSHLKYIPVYLDWNHAKKHIKNNYMILGEYSAKTNRISLVVPQSPTSFETAALHEIIHAITVRAYDKNKEFRDSIDKLFKIAKDSLKDKGKNYYGLVNAKEFIAESLTDLNFIDALRSIPYEDNNSNKSESIFSKFIDCIIKFITERTGKSNISKNTLHDAVVSNIEQYGRVVFNNEVIGKYNHYANQKSPINSNVMYHLEKDFEELDKIIEDRINVETKKTKIIKSDKAVEAANRKIKNLEAIQDGTPEGKLKGIINYAHNAVKDLGAAREALGNSKSGERNFAMLRGIRATIQSYDDFIRQISALINTKDEDLIKLIMDTEIEDKHHTIVKMKQAYDELSSLYNLVKEDFKSVLLDSVEEFFTPFFDVKDGKFVDGSGKERTLRELIQEANGDISFTDRYLMTMSSSGDLLLQLFDAVVGQAKAHARYKTIDDINEIVRIMLNAEEKGVTNFDWIYEKDSDGKKTGNYISEINTGQFEKDKQEFLRQLEEEYGANPTGEKAKEKKAKRKAWMSSHGKNHGVKPNEVMYRNSEFDKLTTAQKEVLNDIMRLKQKFDRRLPSNKVSTTRAIQMRRTSQQRLLNSLSNPEQAFKNIQESIAKEFTLSTDDDQIYGEKTGLRSFDGSEFKVLPALYTTRLSNPDELTSDIFSALAAYSYSTNIYEEMDAIVDPLELAKAWVKEGREVREMANGKELVEKVNGIVNPILKKGGSNIVDKLEDFMDSQVYSRYYADSDKTINVMGKELKAGKIVNKWMSLSSAVQLGFNALSQLGNAATGIAMQNIEAFCGHYFNAKELLKADGAYLNELPKFISEVESRNPTGKLALFDQLFDIKQEFADNTKRRMNTLFEKLFGNTVAYLGQTCGDHWLYNRTAIAMCQRKKVRLSDGTITSLWDALKVVDAFEGDSRIKKLTIDAVDAETGQVIDLDYIHEYSDKINKINHRLFGVYNTDDMVAAQRVALGRAVLQYRQWIVPMFARRFQAREYNLSLGEYEEGYYRTLLRVVAGLRGGMHGVMEVWDELDEAGKRNVYRSLIEMSQFMLIWAIANFVQFGKGDPDRNWGMKLAEYMAQRELHELGNLTPSFTMGNEILKTVKSPATILNTTQAAMNLAASLLDPRDWNDEIESGKYEGMSTLHKNILKAPFPILAPFNQLDRFTDSLEEVTRYYARPQ